MLSVAREGADAPGPWNAANGRFHKFQSLALADGSDGGPLFVASLAGASEASDVGLWGVDSTGSVRLLLREGQSVGVKTVQSFTVLSAVLQTAAQTRSFNAAHQVVARITFTDHTQALSVISVP